MLKITAIGNLTKDATLRQVNTKNGQTSVLDLNFAVNGFENGQKTTTFVRASVWGKRAESIHKFMLKGAKIAVSGSPKVETYMTKDGKPAATLNIQVGTANDDIEIVSYVNQPEGSAPKANYDAPPAPMEEAKPVETPDDLPF